MAMVSASPHLDSSSVTSLLCSVRSEFLRVPCPSILDDWLSHAASYCYRVLSPLPSEFREGHGVWTHDPHASAVCWTECGALHAPSVFMIIRTRNGEPGMCYTFHIIQSECLSAAGTDRPPPSVPTSPNTFQASLPHCLRGGLRERGTSWAEDGDESASALACALVKDDKRHETCLMCAWEQDRPLAIWIWVLGSFGQSGRRGRETQRPFRVGPMARAPSYPAGPGSKAK